MGVCVGEVWGHSKSNSKEFLPLAVVVEFVVTGKRDKPS